MHLKYIRLFVVVKVLGGSKIREKTIHIGKPNTKNNILVKRSHGVGGEFEFSQVHIGTAPCFRAATV